MKSLREVITDNKLFWKKDIFRPNKDLIIACTDIADYPLISVVREIGHFLVYGGSARIIVNPSHTGQYAKFVREFDRIHSESNKCQNNEKLANIGKDEKFRKAAVRAEFPKPPNTGPEGMGLYHDAIKREFENYEYVHSFDLPEGMTVEEGGIDVDLDKIGVEAELPGSGYIEGDTLEEYKARQKKMKDRASFMKVSGRSNVAVEVIDGRCRIVITDDVQTTSMPIYSDTTIKDLEKTLQAHKKR